MVVAMEMRTFTLLCALILPLAGCETAPGTQRLPIGSHCSSADECGTTPYVCAPGYPGGYCEAACATDGDCPMDSYCIAKQCRRRCSVDGDCRTSEGYTCRPLGGTGNVCELPTTAETPDLSIVAPIVDMAAPTG